VGLSLRVQATFGLIVILLSKVLRQKSSKYIGLLLSDNASKTLLKAKSLGGSCV